MRDTLSIRAQGFLCWASGWSRSVKGHLGAAECHKSQDAAFQLPKSLIENSNRAEARLIERLQSVTFPRTASFPGVMMSPLIHEREKNPPSPVEICLNFLGPSQTSSSLPRPLAWSKRSMLTALFLHERCDAWPVEPSASCFNGSRLCLRFFGVLLVTVLSPSSSLLCPPSFSPGWKLSWAYRFMRYSSLASSCWRAVLWHRFPWQWWSCTSSTYMPKHSSLIYIKKKCIQCFPVWIIQQLSWGELYASCSEYFSLKLTVQTFLFVGRFLALHWIQVGSSLDFKMML